MPLFKKGKKAPAEAFDEGWQFYSKATTLEPPGTVFRINAAGRRYQVGKIDVETEKGDEALASLVRRWARQFWRYLPKPESDAEARKEHQTA